MFLHNSGLFISVEAHLKFIVQFSFKRTIVSYLFLNNFQELVSANLFEVNLVDMYILGSDL